MLLAVTIGAALLALAFLAAGIRAWRQRRYLGFAGGTMVALLLFVTALLAATISLATQGYRALTREEIAAVVDVVPRGPNRFTAAFTFPDGRREAWALTGDQLYVDAHILKWKPLANVLGLHTAYELDRVGGRYVTLEAERDSVRTIFSLKPDRTLDMFTLRRRYAFFAPLLDAEYGSGTFVMADRPVTLEVLVSTSGLLIRPREDR